MILWAGGEDIDFPNGTAVDVNTVNTAGWRSGYARCLVGNNGGGGSFVRSVTFAAQTSFWVSAQMFPLAPFITATTERFMGLMKSGTSKGLILGSGASSGQMALYKYDGSTYTLLASESGTSITTGIKKLDIQVIAFGGAATVNIWVAGALVITYTGSTAISGISDLDQFSIAITSSSLRVYFSEIIVSDSDTRSMSLVTLAPTALGTTHAWTGAYTDVSEVTINDSTKVTTNTPAQDEQFTLNALPSGTDGVLAVKVAARALATVAASASTVGLGVNSGGTVDPGTLQAPTTSFTTYERLMLLNPVTSAGFTRAEVNALQLNLRSGV